MMHIKQYPNEVLKQISTDAPLIESTYELANMMVQTMEANRGIGLAAVQVGFPIKLIVIKLSTGANLKMANPEIIQFKGQPVLKEEGCLSFKSTYAMVKRYTSLVCRYYNLDTNTNVQRLFTNRDAHVIQHEIDHLYGRLIYDHLNRPMAEKFLAEYKLRNKL